MKCPKCNYVSFDYLTECKKCGLVFKKNSGSEPLVTFKSPISDTKTSKGDMDQTKKPSDISKTLASIQESINEIEADEVKDIKSSAKGETAQGEGDLNRLKRGYTSVEEDKRFPAFNEINWEESVSLSSDELNLDFADLAKEEREIGLADEKSDKPDIKKEQFKEELERIGEELKQIEEEPESSEPEYPSELPETTFDLSRVRKGGFWIRFIAYMIDNLILSIFSLILLVLGIIAFGLGSSGLAELGEDNIFILIVPLYIFYFIITIAYYTYFHGSTGQTIGKMACRLKVIKVDGKPLGYGKAFLRWVGYIISGFIFNLGYLWAAWDKNKQAWHDKIAGSYVIRI